MRVNALVVDLGCSARARGSSSSASRPPCPAWAWWSARAARASRSGCAACAPAPTTGSRSPATPRRCWRAIEAVVRRRKRASARVDTGPLVAGELEIRADQFQAFVARPQRGPHPARVRAAPAAGPGRGQGAPARGDLPGGLGLRDGPRRPLRGRVRAQGAPEARDRPRRTGATSTRTSAWATASSPSGPGGPDEAAAFEAELQAPARPEPAGILSRLSHLAILRPHVEEPADRAAGGRAVVVVVAIVVAVAVAGSDDNGDSATTTTQQLGRDRDRDHVLVDRARSRRSSSSTSRAASRSAACRTSR